jgi:hypothetical protein
MRTDMFDPVTGLPLPSLADMDEDYDPAAIAEIGAAIRADCIEQQAAKAKAAYAIHSSSPPPTRPRTGPSRQPCR